MFFEKEMVSFHILDVIYLNQTEADNANTGRCYSALSFRYRAKTSFETKESVYTLHPNTVSYIPAGLEYRRRTQEDELIVVHFDVIDYQTEKIELFESEDDGTLGALFRKILDCWEKKETGYRYQCAAILYEILGSCYEQNFKKENAPSKIQPSVEYILKNYKNEQITMAEIAEKSFMSEVHFRRVFKKSFGITPKKYIIQLKIQNAVGLISTGYYSLAEVAEMSGYKEYKYFAVEFKKHMGVSPSEYTYNYGK